MSIDKPRIARLVSSAKNVATIMLNPSDSDQVRSATIRKMTDVAIKASNQKSLLLLLVEL